MKKKSMAPEGVLTQDTVRKGISSGWVTAMYPIDDLIKDPAKRVAIEEILKNLQSNTGISIPMMELPMLHLIDPDKAYTVNGRPAIFLQKGPERTRNKQKYLTGVKVLYLDTYEVVDEGELDPATIAHTEIVREMQKNASYILNHFIHYHHNKLVDFVCSGKNTPIQNIRFMLQRAKRQLKERIAELKFQQEYALKPVNFPEHLISTQESLMSDIGISQDNNMILANPDAPKIMADTIEKQFVSIVSSFWDRPNIILRSDTSEIVKLFKNTPNIPDEAKIEIVEALKKIMEAVSNQQEEERKKRYEYEKRRSQTTGEKGTPEEADDAATPPATPQFQDWVLRYIQPISEDVAHKVIRATSIVSPKYKGISSARNQGKEIDKSIQKTEVDIAERTLENVDLTIKLIKDISEKLKSQGHKTIISAMSPDQVRSLCEASEMLGEFTRTYATPVVDKNNKIDKKKMGVGSKPLANIAISSYLALCQQALRGIACEGNSEDKYAAGGDLSLCGKLDEWSEIN